MINPPIVRLLRAAVCTALAPIAVSFETLHAQTEAAVLHVRPDTEIETVATPATGAGSALQHFVVQLTDEPAATTFARESQKGRAIGFNAARGQVRKLQQAQTELRNKLPARTQVLYGTQRSLNALVVRAPAEDRAALAALPGVASVTEYVPHELNAASSAGFLGAPGVWEAAGLNVRGDGVRVGIIDSGIDYRHTHFGGDGSTVGNNPAIVEPGTFPTAKVVGGWDFVGFNYNAGGTAAQQIPSPDPDPLDDGSHGTGVAGLAAGFGVNANGTTYTGSYGNATDIAALRISPGLAPHALLYALKVFGNAGSTAYTYQAIEWSMDPNGDGDMSDHLDIINMSLGSANGATDDLTTTVANEAAKLGIVVVASAGNSYDTYYITGSPAVADGAISVAASLNSEFFITAQVNQPADLPPFVATVPAFGPALTQAGVTANLVLANPLVGINNPNAALTNAADVAGKIVVMQRGGGIGFTVKVRNAQNSGALAVLMVNNVPGLPISMGGADAMVAIPSTMIGLGEGELLFSLLQSGPVNATLSSLPNPSGADLMASYSSRGPRRGDSFLKPDITAPAELVSTASSGTGTASRTFNGTSSAAPHVAGAMALLRQAKPTWSNFELKALVMNTASYDLFSQPYATPPRWGLSRIGAGRMDVAAAARTDVVAFDAARPDLVSLSFGVVDVVTNANLPRELTIANKGSSAVTYAATYESLTSLPGVSVKIIGNGTVRVPAGGRANLKLALEASGSALRNAVDASLALTQGAGSGGAQAPRHTMPEEGGYIVLKPTSGQGAVLRVPLHAIVRPAARLHVSPNNVTLPADHGQLTLTMGGRALATGPNPPYDLVSLVKPFELQHVSGTLPGLAPSKTGADLRAVGVTSDYAQAGNLAATWIAWGIASHGNINTPSTSGVTYQIRVDRDRNGTTDMIVFSNARPDATTGSPASVSNVYTTSFTNTANNTTSSFVGIHTNGLPASTATTHLLNNSTYTILMPASNLGLTSGRFNYVVDAVYRGELIDSTPVLTYDVTAPGVVPATASFEPLWLVGVPEQTITLNYHRSHFQANGSLGVLLLHPLNEPAHRAEVVTVRP